MEEYQLFALARAFHVLGVVLWIGGVAFVTSVLLPAVKQQADSRQRLALFETLESRFAIQAMVTTLITGVSGFYMLDYLGAWDRFLQPQFWWMHLMVLVWLLFSLILFVLEPLFLHRWFRQQALRDSEATFQRVHRLHKVLLSVSLLTVFGAVAGAHGLLFGA